MSSTSEFDGRKTAVTKPFGCKAAIAEEDNVGRTSQEIKKKKNSKINYIASARVLFRFFKRTRFSTPRTHIHALIIRVRRVFSRYYCSYGIRERFFFFHFAFLRYFYADRARSLQRFPWIALYSSHTHTHTLAHGSYGRVNSATAALRQELLLVYTLTFI